MAHFAKLDSNNVVLQVDVVDNSILDPESSGNENEELGRKFLEDLTGHANWKKTSYNTSGNEHKLGGTPFRKNYAIIGGKYDSSRDAFLQPTTGSYPHYASWSFNETTCLYDAPKAKPTDSERTADSKTLIIFWNEDTTEWRGTDHDDDSVVYKFDSTNKTWTLIS